jgi:hypothetical protein
MGAVYEAVDQMNQQSHRSELNRRPLDYESSALPLSYCGDERDLHALARIRTATPCGTTPSRWRVYQFHHQGKKSCNGADGARTRNLSSDSRVL